MNQLPLPYPDGSFDAVTCVGTVTYLEPAVLGKFVIRRPITWLGGLVCYTNRTDKLEAWKEAETSQLQLKVVDISEPLPYLPGNIEFADKVLVTIRLLFRVAKY
jgi:hypothetical protein